MALFAMQLVCVVVAAVPAFQAANDFTVVINQMLNVIIIIIIRSVHSYFCFADNIYLARASHQR